MLEHEEGRKDNEKNKSMFSPLVFAKLCLMIETEIVTFYNVVHNGYKRNV